MKNIATGLFLATCFSFGLMTSAQAVELQEATPKEEAKVAPRKSNATVVGIVSGQSKEQFEAQIMPILKAQTEACARCEIVNLTPYTSKAEFDVNAVAAQLAESAKQVNFLVINWNSKYHPELEPIVAALKKLISEDVVIIGAAGVAKYNENLLPISRTVLGQVPDLVIVGELEQSERLLNHGYYGPEMLTAIRPPKEFMGLGFASLFFGSRLATNWNQRSSEDWLVHFKSTKSKTRRMWPSLEDFFGRGKRNNFN